MDEIKIGQTKSIWKASGSAYLYDIREIGRPRKGHAPDLFVSVSRHASRMMLSTYNKR